MPRIEVFARWNDAEGKAHSQFVSSLSTSTDEFLHARTTEWMADAIRRADVIERAERMTVLDAAMEEPR